MNTRDYIQTAKEHLGIRSDYALAKWLGISTAALTRYQNGDRTIDDYSAAKLAEAIGIPAIEIIATANWEREKDGKRREFWAKFRGIAHAASMFIFVIFSTAYNMDAQAGEFTSNSTVYPLCEFMDTEHVRIWHGSCPPAGPG